MEELIGVPVPYVEEQDEGMPEAVELQIARLAAAASNKLLQRDQNEIAAQQAQQAAQDPLVQIQQQEMAIKAKEVELKEKKLMTDAAAKADQLNIEKERITSQERIAGMNASLKVRKETEDLQARREIEGTKMTVDLLKTLQQKGQQKKQ
jgi:hypothetical protein